jgi:predicted TIM-barrel fold metal-dependent hydrolase
LGRQEREKVREFFIRYQDRIMFGSDRSAMGQLTMKPDELEESLQKLTDALQLGWDYYATDKVVIVNGQACHGLALPQEVLLKIFSTNAERWFPGLAPPEA